MIIAYAAISPASSRKVMIGKMPTGIIDAAPTEGHIVYPLPAQGFTAGKNIKGQRIFIGFNNIQSLLLIFKTNDR